MLKRIQKINRKIYKLLQNENTQLTILAMMMYPALYGTVYIVLLADNMLN